MKIKLSELRQLIKEALLQEDNKISDSKLISLKSNKISELLKSNQILIPKKELNYLNIDDLNNITFKISEFGIIPADGYIAFSINDIRLESTIFKTLDKRFVITNPTEEFETSFKYKGAISKPNENFKEFIINYFNNLKRLIKENNFLIKEDSAGIIELTKPVTIKHEGKNIKFVKGDTFKHYRSGGFGDDFFVKQGVYYDANEFPKGSFEVCI